MQSTKLFSEIKKYKELPDNLKLGEQLKKGKRKRRVLDEELKSFLSKRYLMKLPNRDGEHTIIPLNRKQDTNTDRNRVNGVMGLDRIIVRLKDKKLIHVIIDFNVNKAFFNHYYRKLKSFPEEYIPQRMDAKEYFVGFWFLFFTGKSINDLTEYAVIDLEKIWKDKKNWNKTLRVNLTKNVWHYKEIIISLYAYLFWNPIKGTYPTRTFNLIKYNSLEKTVDEIFRKENKK